MAAAANGPGEEDSEAGYIGVLNRFFERVGVWCYDHRVLVLAVSLVLFGLCLVVAAGIRFDNSFENYFDRGDPAYAAYLQYRDDFGSDEVSYIVYDAPDTADGPFDLAVMRKIEKLTRVLEEEVPFVKEVTSLANVEFLDPVPGGLEVHELLETFPETREAMLAIRDKVLAKPLYVGGLVSADGRYAALMLEMEKSSIDPLDEIRLDPEGGDGLANLYPQATYDKIEEILARPEYTGIQFLHTGDVPLNAVINQISYAEGSSLGLLTFAVIAAVLLAFFRRPIGVVGPMAVVALATFASIAFIGLVGWHLDLFFGMLPNLLIAVGVGAAVHIVSEFRSYHSQLGDRREAIRRTLHLVGTPCLFTSLTTAAGFASMWVSPIRTLSHFAVYSSVGVLAAFVFSMTLLLAFLSLGRASREPRPQARERAEAKGGALSLRSLDAIARFDLRWSRAILAVTGLVFVVSGVGAGSLRVDSNFMLDFSEEVPIRGITERVEQVMGGTNSLVYLFDTGTPDGIKDPAVLREIERLQQAADGQTDVVRKTYSIVDLLKDINQSFHDGDPAWYVLPETRDLVAQYLLVYEMSGGDELDNYVSSDYSRASLELRARWIESSRIAVMDDNLSKYLEAQPLQASVATTTGIGALWLQLLDYITWSQINGFALAFVVIAAMMCLLFGSLKIGLIAMIPNLLPVALTLGIMGALGIALSYTTLLIAPIAIGIAVDDTMHLMTRFRHEFHRCGRYEEALFASLRDVGRAISITSIVLVLGFLVSLLSVMDSQASFGVLLAFTISIALVADLLLMPALILVFRPFGPERVTGEPGSLAGGTQARPSRDGAAR